MAASYPRRLPGSATARRTGPIGLRRPAALLGKFGFSCLSGHLPGRLTGLLAGKCAGKLFIEMSTVRPEVERKLAADVAAKGARMIECPVGGTTGPAREGRLLGFVGGEDRKSVV